jgi:hypothetical protein
LLTCAIHKSSDRLAGYVDAFLVDGPDLRMRYLNSGQDSSRSENIIWRCNEEGEALGGLQRATIQQITFISL